MKSIQIFYVYFLFPLFSLMYTFPSLIADPVEKVNSENVSSVPESIENQVTCITREELARLLSQSKLDVKSKSIKKKVLSKKNSWNKLIAITGDVDKDFNSVISLLETSKDANWDNWKLIPEIDPVIIRSDYITEINGYKVRTAFVTYADTKKTFLQNAWVVSE